MDCSEEELAMGCRRAKYRDLINPNGLGEREAYLLGSRKERKRYRQLMTGRSGFVRRLERLNKGR